MEKACQFLQKVSKQCECVSQLSPTLALGAGFMNNFSMHLGQGRGWFWGDSSILHLLCTLFLLWSVYFTSTAT